MKRFLFKLIMFFLALGTITLGVNALYVAKAGYPEAFTKERYESVPDQIDISIFGSSHAEGAFVPDLFGDRYRVFKFSGGNQVLSQDARLMEYYRDRMREGGYALITVSYFSLFGIPEEETEVFASRNKAYYWALPPRLIKQYDPLTDLCVRYLPSLTAYFDIFRLLPFTGGYRQHEEPVPQTEEEQYLSDIGGQTTKERVAETVGLRYEQHLVKEKLDENGERIVNREEIDALYRMIAICKEEGVTPVLVTTPVIAEYSGMIHEKDPAFFEQFYGIIDQIRKETGAAYYDYSEDERFIHDYTLFADNDHTNLLGSSKFTRLFAQEALGITLP